MNGMRTSTSGTASWARRLSGGAVAGVLLLGSGAALGAPAFADDGAGSTAGEATATEAAPAAGEATTEEATGDVKAEEATTTEEATIEEGEVSGEEKSTESAPETAPGSGSGPVEDGSVEPEGAPKAEPAEGAGEAKEDGPVSPLATETTMQATGAAPVVAAAPPGDNGTVKIHRAGTPVGDRRDQPKVCVFYLDAFGFDGDQDLVYRFYNGKGFKTAVGTPGTIDVDAGGDGHTPNLTLPDGRYKLRVNFPGEHGFAKQKVFTVDCPGTPGGPGGENPPPGGGNPPPGGIEPGSNPPPGGIEPWSNPPPGGVESVSLPRTGGVDSGSLPRTGAGSALPLGLAGGLLLAGGAAITVRARRSSR